MIIKKPWKSQLYFFLHTQSLLIGRIIKNKRGLELVTSHFSGYETSSKYSFIHYILSDQVWWHNVKQFLSYSKNYICKFMQLSLWHHKLFHFHLSFWFWKLWKGRKKITKIWISREQRDIYRWIKKKIS